MAPTVSVIIPAHDNAATLGRTITCLQDQSRADWEAIIACDGSTARTIDVADRAAANDPRIRVLRLDHGGVSRARNAAIRESKGKWLLFLDADDTVATDFMAHMLQKAQAQPVPDIVACGYNRIDELGRVSARFRPLPLDRDALAVCVAGPPGPIHGFLASRERVIAVGGFDETLVTNEDWDLWLRIAAAGAVFRVSRRKLANYWSTPNSLSRNSQQMVRDAGLVQLRAQSHRVAPRPGMEAFDRRDATYDELQLRNAMWSAGVAIGQLNPVPDLFASISPTVEYRHDKLVLVAKLFDGLVVGTGTGYAAVALRWIAIQAGVDAFLEQLGRFVGDPDTRPMAQALQVEIARAGRYRDPIDFGHVVGVPLTFRILARGYIPKSSADMVVFRVHWLRPSTVFSFAGPLTGPLSGADVRAIILRGFTRRIGRHLQRHPRLLQAAAHLNRGAALARRAIGRRRHEPPHVPILSACRTLARSIADEQAAPDAFAPMVETKANAGHPSVGATASEWDRFFEREDPWNYESDYERIKYDRTLALLKPVPTGTALEIACAEGRFTARLATIAARVHAVDISARAIARAQERTQSLPTISYEQRDVFQAGIEGRFDIITCSEMLYFIGSTQALEPFAARIAGALKPGGQFVHAHAFTAGDSPGRTAFDWSETIGAQSIFAVFARTAGLRHHRSIVTDLYRIDHFVADDTADRGSPLIETLPIGCTLEDRVAADVLWGGAVRRRGELERQRTYRLPVLLYHGVRGDDDARARTDLVSLGQFEAQLRFLRRRGYWSIDPDRWRTSAARAGALRGRPIMLTFEGLGGNFVDRVWPVIRRNGFAAHVFVTPDEIAALHRSDPNAIAALVRDGMTFGSRLNDVAADRVPSTDLVRVAVAARLAIGAITGRPVTSIAVPEGLSDPRIELIMAATGHDRLFLNDGDAAWVCGHEMNTPRIEITSDMSLADLTVAIGSEESPQPDEHDLAHDS